MGDIVESDIQPDPGFDALLPGLESFEGPFDLSVVGITQFALDAPGRSKSGESAHIAARPLDSIVSFRLGADRLAAT